MVGFLHYHSIKYFILVLNVGSICVLDFRKGVNAADAENASWGVRPNHHFAITGGTRVLFWSGFGPKDKYWGG